MRLDIIIPAYNAHETLPRTLASIACQTILSEIDVTIVNDASEKDYSDIINSFSSFMSIREIRLDVNGGPGVARQYGIDNTHNPLLTFIDADDTFAGAFVLHVLRKQLLSDSKYTMCVGGFVQHQEEPEVYTPHQQDLVWMFGKMYHRSFLDRNKIRFHPTSRANEDTGFNTICRLVSSEQEQIKFIQDIIYFWHSSPNSITRINNCQYSYDGSFTGYVENMIYAVKEAKKRRPFSSPILHWGVQTMVLLYEYWIEGVERDSRFTSQNWESCQKYYNEVYRNLSEDVTQELLAFFYNEVMRNSYAGNKLIGIIPVMGIKEFLDRLGKGASYEGEY